MTRRRLIPAVLMTGALAASGMACAADAGALPYLPVFMQQWDGTTGTLDTNGIALKSDPARVTLEIGGRLHYDVGAGGVSPKLNSPVLSGNGVVRRAWFEPRLIFTNGLALSLQYDFSNTTTPIKDALISYKGWGPVLVAAGNLKEPFSLDQLQSNNSTLFTERSLLDTFAPGRDFGAVVGTHGQKWTLAAGVFGGNGNTGLADNGIAGTARLTYAPILSDDEVLHLAVAGSYRALDRNGTGLSFSDTPEDFLFSTSLVDSGTIKDAGAVSRLGLELAYELNPFRIDSEYVVTSVSGTGAPDRTFQAGYVEASWMINGHQRNYRLAPRFASEYGVFEGVKVADEQRVSSGGAGVFECGARFSVIDLQSGRVRGGAERDATVGLNWYPDNNIRFMADYVRAHADPSADSVTGKIVDSNLFVGRLQVYW